KVPSFRHDRRLLWQGLDAVSTLPHDDVGLRSQDPGAYGQVDEDVTAQGPVFVLEVVKSTEGKHLFRAEIGALVEEVRLRVEYVDLQPRRHAKEVHTAHLRLRVHCCGEWADTKPLEEADAILEMIVQYEPSQLA